MSKIMFHLNCLEQGGAERVVSNLANAFSESGDEVIVATEWKGEQEFSLNDSVKRIIVGITEEENNKSRISKIFLRNKHLKDCIKKEQPDVVIAFTQAANYRALMVAKGLEVPVIIAVRTDPVGHYDRPIDKIMIPLTYPRADGCVFQTTGQRDFFPEYIRNKSVIILNPVNPKYVGVPAPEVREKAVVHAGRIVDFKNQPMLIEAFCKVHEKYPEHELRIYGPDSFDGTLEILKKKIADNNAESFVKLMGGSDSLEKELPRGEVYAFSSDWEGLPNALIEAMVLGMPIVATDCPCGGPATIMTDGVDGLLVPIKDSDAMAAGICRLLEDRELAERLGQNARKLEERVNSDAIIRQWHEYIEQVIESKKKK
ncbi:MAG: glycosyltransferase [Lachnospiraceae bacterium]|nr:glycosyltransferase [Candidatus Colinaster scatohippi]